MIPVFRYVTPLSIRAATSSFRKLGEGSIIPTLSSSMTLKQPYHHAFGIGCVSSIPSLAFQL